MWAARNGHEAAMKVLLQAGADPTVQDQVSEGVSEGVSECCFSCADVCVAGECRMGVQRSCGRLLMVTRQR
jgi:hypothetical protein